MREQARTYQSAWVNICDAGRVTPGVGNRRQLARNNVREQGSFGVYLVRKHPSMTKADTFVRLGNETQFLHVRDIGSLTTPRAF